MTSFKSSTSHAAAGGDRAVREQLSTPCHATSSRLRHAWLIALAASLAACGAGESGPRAGTYASAEHKEQACCESLAGAARDQCLAQIPQVDKSLADEPNNQATYACVLDHFVCDPQTGRASKESAQAQYDCISDLGN